MGWGVGCRKNCPCGKRGTEVIIKAEMLSQGAPLTMGLKALLNNLFFFFFFLPSTSLIYSSIITFFFFFFESQICLDNEQNNTIVKK